MPDPEKETKGVQSRQRPGLACEECRARKLRCDRGRPCSNCRDAGANCATNTARKPRGPERGLMKTLQTRIAAIEQRIELKSNPVDDLHGQCDIESIRQRQKSSHDLHNIQLPLPDQALPLTMQYHTGTFEPTSSPTEGSQDAHHHSVLAQDPLMTEMQIWPPYTQSEMALDFGDSFDGGSRQYSFPRISADDSGAVSESTSSSKARSVKSPAESSQSLVRPSSFAVEPSALNELVKADLTQLYFDRVHEFVPMLNQRRFLAQVSSGNASYHFDCLQHSMWTLASAMASQFQDIRTMLYSKTKSMLDHCTYQSTSSGHTSLEIAQAWALVALYETCQLEYQCGWLSAGRCFRLIQLMKLHEVDRAPSRLAADAWSLDEERRRVFWVAFVLDRIISLKERLPFTFREHEIMTRLPAAEASFQQDEPERSSFLHETIMNDSLHEMTSFKRLIITLYISSVYFFRQPLEAQAGLTDGDNTTPRENPEDILDPRLLLLGGQDSFSDPLATFASLFCQAAVMHLCSTCQGGSTRTMATVSANLTATLQCLAACSYFKIHPLTPILLLISAGPIRQLHPSVSSTHDQLSSIVSLLVKLSPGSALAQACLSELNGWRVTSL